MVGPRRCCSSLGGGDDARRCLLAAGLARCLAPTREMSTRLGRFEPATARTRELSIAARDQAIRCASLRRATAPRARPPTPRRQQVIPEQPISCGSYSAGIPLCKTKGIPSAPLARCAKRRDQAILGHLGAAGDVRLPGTCVELLLGELFQVFPPTVRRRDLACDLARRAATAHEHELHAHTRRS